MTALDQTFPHGITVNALTQYAQKKLDGDCAANPWNYTNHGTEIYEEDIKLDCYLACYGTMHQRKLDLLFKHLPWPSFPSEINVVDWGCGQGLATLYFMEFCRQHQHQCNIGQVKLIEPSHLALDRAQTNVLTWLDGACVDPINKRLDDVTDEDLHFNHPLPTVHFFSNILDIPGIDLKRLAKHIHAQNKQDHYVLCVSPFVRAESNERILRFASYFGDQFDYHYAAQRSANLNEGFTYFIKSFKVNAGEHLHPTPFIERPAKQFCAAFELDAISSLGVFKKTDAYFDTFANFDIGASFSQDIHPLLAVIHNIIARGLPTKASPFLERYFARAFNLTEEIEHNGTFCFKGHLPNSINTLLTQFQDSNLIYNDFGFQLRWSPIHIARIQKTILETLIAGKLSLDSEQWNILIEEKDVPCASLAIEDLENHFKHLIALTKNFNALRLPRIHLTIINESRFAASPLQSRPDLLKKQKDVLKENRHYDLFISLMSSNESDLLLNAISSTATAQICSTQAVTTQRIIYTTNPIQYQELTYRDAQGVFHEHQEPVKTLTYFLQLLFRKKSFREGQLPILSRALSARSVIGLLPTGGGKSLTYQLAALLQPGVTLVIDPLVSLMKDQFDGLLKLGIDCCAFINTQTLNKENEAQRMERSELLFAFLSPERLCIDAFRRRLRNMQALKVYFSYGVIDEAHCVSEWGHDFRFSYLHLGRNLYQYALPKQSEAKTEHIVLFGLTATASFDVLADVERELSGNGAFLLDPDVIVRYENTNRLELQYYVHPIKFSKSVSQWDVYEAKNNLVSDILASSDQKLAILQKDENIDRIKNRYIERESIESDALIEKIKAIDLKVPVSSDWLEHPPYLTGAIVFCPHTKGTIGVKSTDKSQGIADSIKEKLSLKHICSYVGGDSFEAQDRFIADQSPLMVATKAFGMGIDKPNIRFTVNINHSGSLEAFVQEAGRAGRDRKMALATILYSPNIDKFKKTGIDYGVHKYFHDSSFQGEYFEKIILHFLLSQWPLKFKRNGHSAFEESIGFLSPLLAIETGEGLTVALSYDLNCHRNASQALLATLKKHDYSELNASSFSTALQKAIYRMCRVGIIDDFTQDYASKTLQIQCTKKTDEAYFDHLEAFLRLYYAEEKAKAEVAKAHANKGRNAIEQCLGFLTAFTYQKIVAKRERAIEDIESFCQEAIAAPESNWLETNEYLKDYIYYYFNSKYARKNYQTENGEPFSLTDDSDEGKVSSFDLVFKYMRVVDDDVVTSSGSPKDNLMHLQGAIQLIRRSLTDRNPMLDLLNVYCLLSLGLNENANRKKAFEKNFIDGYVNFLKEASDKSIFYQNMKRFKKEMIIRNVISPYELGLLGQFETIAETIYHAQWLKNFTQSFTKKNHERN